MPPIASSSFVPGAFTIYRTATATSIHGRMVDGRWSAWSASTVAGDVNREFPEIAQSGLRVLLLS